MRRHLTLLALTAGLLLPAGAVHAQNAKTLEDFRCVIVAMFAADSKDEEDKEDAMLLVSYYLGKIDAREPGFDGKRYIDQEMNKLLSAKEGEIKRFTKACYDGFENSQDRMGKWVDD